VKSILIIYNIIFLFAGQTLFQSLHHIIEHNHDDLSHECEECIEFRKNNTLSIENNKFKFYNLNSVLFIESHLSNVGVQHDAIHLSRAPPYKFL
jgi:hypothetical protein